MLAYVFWHRPARGEDAGAYERALGGFHAALAVESCAVALDDAPWLGDGGPAYEDWYLVPTWAALGELNEAAVSGARSGPHDAAAARAADGIAGVYALLDGAAEPPAHGWRAWLAKPPGVPYAAFHDELRALLPAGGAVWQRQMTLGPAGEYALSAPAPLELPWPARAGAVRRVV